MKLLIVSDTHGRSDRLEELLSMHKNADALIFLGDGLKDLLRADAYNSEMAIIPVKGNCDGLSFLGQEAADELEFNFEGYKFLALHGHTRGVKGGLEPAVTASVMHQADVLLFGHTHTPLEQYLPEGSEYEYGALPRPLYIFNPGSLGASSDGKGHFGLIELKGGHILFSHGEL